MNKLVLLISAFLLITATAYAQEANEAAKPPATLSIVINGETLDNDPPPRTIDGRVLIPLRKVFNALGAEVAYENKVITAVRDGKTIELSPDKKTALVNGQELTLDVPPLLFDGSTYVPLRFVAQAFGDEVAFDAPTKTITVTSELSLIDVPADRIDILKERLNQFIVGNQGAILKVWDLNQTEELYYRGLDDRDTAPYSAEDHTGLLQATQLGQGLHEWLRDTIEAYPLLPKQKAVAFLGLANSIPFSSQWNSGLVSQEEVREFLVEVIKNESDVVVRRQAVLSLAVDAELSQIALEAVLELYENSDNLWETFPVQQFFQYHADQIRQLPNLAFIRSRVAAVESLYTPNILAYLDAQ